MYKSIIDRAKDSQSLWTLTCDVPPPTLKQFVIWSDRFTDEQIERSIMKCSRKFKFAKEADADHAHRYATGLLVNYEKEAKQTQGQGGIGVTPEERAYKLEIARIKLCWIRAFQGMKFAVPEEKWLDMWLDMGAMYAIDKAIRKTADTARKGYFTDPLGPEKYVFGILRKAAQESELNGRIASQTVTVNEYGEIII